MWRAHDHEPADVAVGWDVADFRQASWTEETLAFQFRVADAQTGRRGHGQSHGEAHHHEVRRWIGHTTATATSAGDGLLSRGRYQIKQQVAKVSLI